MFWDSNFWENITINVLSGIVLLMIGATITYLFKNQIVHTYNRFFEKIIISIKKEINQNTKYGGDNVVISGSNHTINFGSNSTKKDPEFPKDDTLSINVSDTIEVSDSLEVKKIKDN